ncbi:nucleotidyltransferase [Methanosarcina sp. MSH10X1]|uniref:nucleotidyltransferase family protein n=1 Tax=Methanosarcina sp. MSH10X1 TaxID=2507075 RepID=UPI000FFBC736|nr:nucleotidyltransferase family protein [Methanosarcina sp. MSH10X1]RXA21202.1 nucleotidyltransferase [Methanosarcina sp. MSH10X1]
MDTILTLKEHEKFIRHKFGVKRIGIFGSFARGEEKESSDLDVLVVFEEGQKTFDNYMDLKFYLEDLFGREVDLVTEKALKPQLKDIIMKDVVYA